MCICLLDITPFYIETVPEIVNLLLAVPFTNITGDFVCRGAVRGGVRRTVAQVRSL